MTIATYQWSLERYHQAIAAGIFADENIELIRGELILMSPEEPAHLYYSDRLSKLLQRLPATLL